MKNKSLYKDTRGNCVFVGYKNNVPAYATIRGTLTDKKYRGDCSGSDKRYSFNMTYSTAIKELYVFESAIDAMSLATIANLIFKSVTAYKKSNRLALGGLNTISLDQYLKDHPQVTTLNLCFDNDNNKVYNKNNISLNKYHISSSKSKVDIKQKSKTDKLAVRINTNI